MQEFMRTCQWFDAAEILADKNAAASSDTYPYNKHFNCNTCWSPDRARADFGPNAEAALSGDLSNIMMCPVTPDEFKTCPYYTPEASQVLKLSYVQNSDDLYTWFSLDKTRLNYGTLEYRVVTWTQDSETYSGFQSDAVVYSAVNSALNSDCYKVAHEIFDDLVGEVLSNHSSESSVVHCPVESLDCSTTSYSQFVLLQRQS